MTRPFFLAAALALGLATPTLAQETAPQFNWHTPELGLELGELYNDLFAPHSNPMIVRPDWLDSVIILGVTPDPAESVPSASLDGQWVLRFARDHAGERVSLPYPVAATYPMTITPTGRISTYFGCNYGSGRISVEFDGTIRQAGIGMTLMACFADRTLSSAAPGSDAEEAVAHAFGIATQVEVTATTLVLRDALFREVARFVRQ